MRRGRLPGGPLPRGEGGTPTVALALLSALAILAAGGPARAEVRVFAADGAVRVDPVTLMVIERHPSVGGRGPAPRYLEHNPVYDAERGTVELQAARNETAAFQVIVDTAGERVRRLDLDFDGLQGPASLAPGREITVFRQWYVHLEHASTHEEAQAVTTILEAWFPVARYQQKLVTSFGPGWYPDPLIPLDGPRSEDLPGLPLSLPSEDNPVPEQRAQGFWIDLWIPPGTPAGTYRGEVRITADSRRFTLPVSLRVIPVDLPDEFNAGLGSISYGFVGEHLIRYGPGEVQDLYRLAHRHRLTLDALYLHPEWNEGQIDWTGYDELVGPLLDGSAFTREAGYLGPGSEQPVRRFVLPNDWNWPVEGDGPGSDRAFREALRAVEAHIIERGWTRTEWSLYINTTDEPHRPEDFELIRDYGELLESADLRRPGLFRYRIDAGSFKSIGREIPGWDLDRIFAEVGEVVDIWNCCGGVPYCPARALAERLEEHPKERAWFYFSNAAGEPAVGSLLIDGEALGPRTWGIIVWRYGLAAGVSWEIGWPTPACLAEPDCSGFGLQGDASLVYLADSLGAEAAVLPSIRLKNLRRGAEDFEYLRLLASSGREELAEAYAVRLVPRALDDGLVPRMRGAWEHNPAVWEQIRREIGLVLIGEARPPDPETLIARAPNPAPPPPGLTRRSSLIFVVLLVLIFLVVTWATEPRRRGRGH